MEKTWRASFFTTGVLGKCMRHRKSYVDHKDLARQFRVNQSVLFPSYTRGGYYAPVHGRVTAVLDKIGLLEVETPYGNVRVEPDQVMPTTQNLPPGYLTDTTYSTWERERAKKVASRYMDKQALYWKDVGRIYTPTRQEMEAGTYTCPHCQENMERVRYKRGQPLYMCPDCMWVISSDDICLPCQEQGEEEEPGYFNTPWESVQRLFRPSK